MTGSCFLTLSSNDKNKLINYFKNSGDHALALLIARNGGLSPIQCRVAKLVLASFKRSSTLGLCFTGASGIAPKLVGGGSGSTGGSGMEGGSTRERNRVILREAWNGTAACNKNNKFSATPFRAVNNAGDLLNRQNTANGGSNQVNTGRIKLAANGSARVLGGSIFAVNDGTGVPTASTNVKYVYDGSDYTRFKKQQSINRNYNDYAFGGAGGSNTFIALNRVRR